MENNSLEKTIKEIKSLGDILVSYNYPVASIDLEEDLQILKLRQITIDGYDIMICYSKADYEDKYCISLQIFGRYSVFLPFNVVSKVAKSFLGEKELSLTEIYQNNRKIYCWCLWANKTDNTPVSFEGRSEKCEYEGWYYKYLEAKEINFY